MCEGNKLAKIISPSGETQFTCFLVHERGSYDHGRYLLYSKEGKLIIEGQFKEGVRSGVWKSYDQDGGK